MSCLQLINQVDFSNEEPEGLCPAVPLERTTCDKKRSLTLEWKFSGLLHSGVLALSTGDQRTVPLPRACQKSNL